MTEREARGGLFFRRRQTGVRDEVKGEKMKRSGMTV